MQIDSDGEPVVFEFKTRMETLLDKENKVSAEK